MMKKTLLFVGLLGIFIIALGIAGFAYAQDQTPETPYGRGMMGDSDSYGSAFGWNRMGDYNRGHGMMGGYGRGWDGEESPMHEAMVAAVAEALGTSPEEIESRHDAGESIWEIAEGEGLTPDEILDLMLSAHNTALAEAVADGWITAEQAEWMNEHMSQMGEGDYGFGAGHCGRQGRFPGSFPFQEGEN